jgi:predicted MFS family arabinose efflux permease
MTEKTNPKVARAFSLLLIIIAASAVYELPYIRYYYYDVMKEALGVSHTQMGTLMSAYGIVAMICYFPGGWLADRISCRKLLAFSLAGTGLGGAVFHDIPTVQPGFGAACILGDYDKPNLLGGDDQGDAYARSQQRTG